MLYYNLLKRMINDNNYSSNEDMKNKIDGFFAKKRITEIQKNELTNLLNEN